MKCSALRRLMRIFITGLALFFLPASAYSAAEPRLKPPAPGPTYLSVNDRDRLLEVTGALKYKRFSDARMATQSLSDPIARSLGEWMRLMAEDPTLTAAEADAFLDAHDDWPAQRRILSFVEKRLTDNVPGNTILALFDSRKPVTGTGKIQLARAYFNAGDQEAGEASLRDAWINHNFSLAEERRILKVYGNRLTRADHAARVDRLLWARQVTNARRIFSRLSSSDRKAAEARAALLLGASSAPNLYRRLSRDEQLDPGMIHAAVRHYRRKGEEQYALSLAADAPQDPDVWRDAARWWDERQLLMRWALREGRFADAYRAAAEHGQKEGGDLAEAEFYAGWIALRFFDNPVRAKTHFLALASSVTSPISRSRAYYWLGRAAMANNDEELATSYYQRAARFYYSYYGQLAAEKLGGDAIAQRFAPPMQSTPAERALFSSRPTVAALRMLSDLNLDYEFMVFAYHVDDQLQYPGEYLELAKLANGEGAPHLTVRAGKVAVHKDAFTPDVAYPLIFIPEEAQRFVAPEIILGLSRQESEFNPRAFSRAGARGVMQLIPSTAQLTARKEGLSYSRSALLDDPIYNMTLGSAHLSHLLDRYDGSLIMTLAAYNAGPHRVTRWVDEYGDPRSPAVDPIDWVEHIPFSETRNYVQRVLENVQVYRGRIHSDAIPGKLASDLERGGPRNRIANGAAPSAVALTKTGATNQDLPPPPARTVQKAQQYAQLLLLQSAPPPVEPDETEPLSDAEQPAAPSDTTPSPADETETRGSSASSYEETANAAPSLNALPQPEETAAVEAPMETLPQPSQTQREEVEETATPVPSEPAQIAVQAPEEITVAEPSAPASEPAQRSSGKIKTAYDFLPPWPGETQTNAEAMTDEIPGPSSPPTTIPQQSLSAQDNDGALDPCLAYRDFLVRNAEEEPDAADLNASMLAELQAGGGCQ